MRGKATLFRDSSTITEDHPRICGEKIVVNEKVADRTGSPPHMRGKETREGRIITEFRITPAYAGKRADVMLLPCGKWDHPRICGEKWYGRIKDAEDQGITPAYAGKSLYYSSFPAMLWDHPRICGEKHPRFIGDFAHKGSPPHMRGKGKRSQ